MNLLNRRDVLGSLLAVGSAGSLLPAVQGDESKKIKQPICVFTKPFQSLTYQQLAKAIAKLGFDGIECPIRDKGYIEPKTVPGELPKLVDALEDQHLELTVLTSSINEVNDLNETVLTTAAKLGVKRYRMKYLRYDDSTPVAVQIKEWNKKLKDLAALNKQLGIRAVYQNHAGNRMLGAALWDLDRALDDISPHEIGVAFDIRHATVEGGQSWPTDFRMILPRLDTVYFKDFKWIDRKPKNVPLGEGQVDLKAFCRLLKDVRFDGPISLHEEYWDHRKPELVPQHLVAIESDFKMLRKSLGRR